MMSLNLMAIHCTTAILTGHCHRHMQVNGTSANDFLVVNGSDNRHPYTLMFGLNVDCGITMGLSGTSDFKRGRPAILTGHCHVIGICK